MKRPIAYSSRPPIGNDMMSSSAARSDVLVFVLVTW
jgi:hypothetical protein